MTGAAGTKGCTYAGTRGVCQAELRRHRSAIMPDTTPHSTTQAGDTCLGQANLAGQRIEVRVDQPKTVHWQVMVDGAKWEGDHRLGADRPYLLMVTMGVAITTDMTTMTPVCRPRHSDIGEIVI